MDRPLNTNPEDYARRIIDEQAAYILELEAGQSAGNVILEYSFSANTAEPPGSGQLRLNAAQSAATKLWAHKLTSTGIDITNAIANFHSGDRVTVQKKNDAGSYARYTLTADAIAKVNYFELPVSFSDTGSQLGGGQTTLLVLVKGPSADPAQLPASTDTSDTDPNAVAFND